MCTQSGNGWTSLFCPVLLSYFMHISVCIVSLLFKEQIVTIKVIPKDCLRTRLRSVLFTALHVADKYIFDNFE